MKFLSLIIVVILLSCRHHAGDLPPVAAGQSGTAQTDTCNTQIVYFRQQVLPILNSNCAMSGCHDEISRQDGVMLTSYQSVMSTAGVRPGNPGESDLYEVLIETDPDKRMPRPPRSPLTAQQIRLVYDWIVQGALDKSCQNLCDSSKFSFSNAIRIIIQNKCLGCHNGLQAQGQTDLSTYAGVKARVDDGKLWGVINHNPGFSPMPKNQPKLSDCEITQVRKWINTGAPEN